MPLVIRPWSLAVKGGNGERQHGLVSHGLVRYGTKKRVKAFCTNMFGRGPRACISVRYGVGWAADCERLPLAAKLIHPPGQHAGVLRLFHQLLLQSSARQVESSKLTLATRIPTGVPQSVCRSGPSASAGRSGPENGVWRDFNVAKTRLSRHKHGRLQHPGNELAFAKPYSIIICAISFPIYWHPPPNPPTSQKRDSPVTNTAYSTPRKRTCVRKAIFRNNMRHFVSNISTPPLILLRDP